MTAEQIMGLADQYASARALFPPREHKHVAAVRALLKADIEALSKDAERYRWLRMYEVDSYRAVGRQTELDSAIDRAMEKDHGA